MARLAVLVLGLSGALLMGYASGFEPCVGDGSVSIGGGECFSIFWNPMKTPADAETACNQLNTVIAPQVFATTPHLATIKTAVENNILLQLIQKISLIAIIGYLPFVGTPPLGSWTDTGYTTNANSYTNLSPDSSNTGTNVTLCANDATTWVYMCKVDGKWHQNCGVMLPYVCRTPTIDPCAPPFASAGWVNVNNRCFKLLSSKERKGAEFVCAGLESQGTSVIYDFNDPSSDVTNVLTKLGVMPGSNQQTQFWLDANPIFNNKYNGDFSYRDHDKGFNGYGRYRRHDNDYRIYDNDYRGYDNDDYRYGHNHHGDKGYDLKKVVYVNPGPPKCLAGVVKGGSVPKFFVSKESCKNEYNVVCELKALPPMTPPATSG